MIRFLWRGREDTEPAQWTSEATRRRHLSTPSPVYFLDSFWELISPPFFVSCGLDAIDPGSRGEVKLMLLTGETDRARLLVQASPNAQQPVAQGPMSTVLCLSGLSLLSLENQRSQLKPESISLPLGWRRQRLPWCCPQVHTADQCWGPKGEPRLSHCSYTGGCFTTCASSDREPPAVPYSQGAPRGGHCPSPQSAAQGPRSGLPSTPVWDPCPCRPLNHLTQQCPSCRCTF